ncbi:UvrD-helicase domain-containing protein [Verrucomicrobium sp. BvORR034]|uniref:ATP-dependent helicase n=1 Tax=Verrucomicrobium sp. BvORR034 TaxID=1396418 RepID=UPI00067871BF|nr:UvrD-helicase domain-containing protein [Verrucomicrobium sp. BvORR034]
MSFAFDQLNLPQREAVKTIHGPVLILAGAGTGKTRTVTMRIAHMVDEGISPANILSVTFTNKAANEMRERVKDMLGPAKGKDITLGTFHAFCMKLLRVHAEAIGYKTNFSIYSQSEQVSLVKKILARLMTKEESLDANVALSRISKAKNYGISLGDAAQSLDAALLQLYTDELRALNAMDFDDLLLKAVELLEEHEDVRKQVQQKLRYAMVDEFQDTNTLQMRLLRALVAKPYNICVVGDDDQSIYGWRGADITNINEFESFFPGAKVIKLEENYRSTTPILHTANSLIKNNVGRRPKSLWSQNPGSQPVRLVLAEDDKEEAELICDEMLEANRKGDKFDDMAVLFRTNDQSRILESEFRKKKIPYRIVGARSFFDRREVKDILAYLHVMANPDDDVSLLRILNTPTRGIGTSTADLARDHSIAKKTSIYAALKDPAFQALLTQRMKMLVGNFIDQIDLFKAHAAQPMVELAPLAEKVIVEIGYRDYLAKLAKTPTDVENWEIGLKMLKQSLTWFDERDNKGTLQDFLDETSLNDDREEKDDITKKTGVCLITMHASKGLEFPIVWLPGLEEGILPHKRSIEEGTKDEERRLFYVGITRAMRRLTLSHCRYRMKWGQKQTCMPSSFLKELDKTHVEIFDHAAHMKEDLTPEDAADFFASLRRQMS